MIRIWQAAVTTIVATIALSNLGCADSNDFGKSDLIAKQPVFPLDANQHQTTNDGNGASVPVEFDCSDQTAQVLGGTIRTISPAAFQLNFLGSGGSVACQLNDPQILQDIINLKVIKVDNLATRCPGLQPGSYTLKIPSPKAGFFEGNDFDSFDYWEVLNSSGYVAAGAGIAVTISGQGQMKLASTNERNFVLYGLGAENPACDYRGNSPLIVRLAQRTPGPIVLSPPLSGVFFDLLGSNGFPKPHTPVQISWFTGADSSDNYFVVLPNASGEVRGIDEMFGNNTRGPDGRFAANGYEALRKWDENHDGRINKHDAIFGKLKLWRDSNLDGVAQENELFSMDQMSVDHFDLNYDSGFAEQDVYGNQTKMKSVMGTSDGRLHLMYDLWFRNL